MTHRGEGLDVVRQDDGGALVVHVDNLALMDAANGEEGLVDIPRILLELLVTEAQTAVFGIDLKDHNLNLLTDLGKLGGVFDLLAPAEVADVDKTVDTFLELDEDTEVGEVAHGGGVLAAHRIFLGDGQPGIRHELTDTEAHLAVLAVERQDDGLHLVAHLQEVLGAAQVLAPAHLADVDETLDTGDNLDESTVVGDDDNFTLDVVAFLEVGIQSIPGVRSELLETEGDAALGLVEVENDDVDLLVELDNLFGVVDTAPAEVGDVDEAIHAAEVDEHTVAGDVLDHAFQHLTLLEVADNLGLLSLDLVLDESLVADNDVLVLMVDFDDLELHLLVDIHIVVADGFDVDLRTGKEGLDVVEHGDNETALGAALDITGDDLLVVVSLIDALPALQDAGLLVTEHQLAIGILLALDIDLNLVAGLQVGVVAHLADGDDTVALGSHIDDHFALGDGDDGTFDNFLLGERVKALVIGLVFVVGFLDGNFTGFLVYGIPIKIGQGLYVLIIHSFWRRKKSSATLFLCAPAQHGFNFLSIQHLEKQSVDRKQRTQNALQRYEIFTI